MQVLIAPDGFGATLRADQSARVLAAGWSTARPGDRVTIAPQSDGGPDFVAVLAAALPGARIRAATVTGPLGAQVQAQWLWDGRDAVAYLESAQACGLHLLGRAPDPAAAWAAGSAGVGQLIAAATRAGAETIVVGLGGSAVTDGGAGMLAVLGADPVWAPGTDPAARPRLIAATDVTNPLHGPTGAAAVFGPQKGADAATVVRLAARLRETEQQYRRWSADREIAGTAGAGAAGGIGAGLIALGADVVSGADLVGRRTGRATAVAAADLVITGEGRIDRQTAGGKVVSRVCAQARAADRPVIALVGASALAVGDQDLLGLGAVFSLTAFAGSGHRARTRAEESARGLAAAVAARTDRAALRRWRERGRGRSRGRTDRSGG